MNLPLSNLNWLPTNTAENEATLSNVNGLPRCPLPHPFCLTLDRLFLPSRPPFWFYCLFFLKCNLEMESSTLFFFQSWNGYLRSINLVLTCRDAASHSLSRSQRPGPNLLTLQGFNSRHSMILKRKRRDLKKMGKRKEEMKKLGGVLQLCCTKGKSFPGSACSTFHAVCTVECRSSGWSYESPTGIFL